MREVERQHRVLQRRQRRQQLKELEHDPDVPTTPGCQLLLAQLIDALPADGHGSRRRPIDTRDHVEDRRLAAARRPDDRDHLAGAIDRSTPRSAGYSSRPLRYIFSTPVSSIDPAVAPLAFGGGGVTDVAVFLASRVSCPRKWRQDPMASGREPRSIRLVSNTSATITRNATHGLRNSSQLPRGNDDRGRAAPRRARRRPSRNSHSRDPTGRWLGRCRNRRPRITSSS